VGRYHVQGLYGLRRDVLFAAVKMCDRDGLVSTGEIRVALGRMGVDDDVSIGGAIKALRNRGYLDRVSGRDADVIKIMAGNAWRVRQWVLAEFRRIPSGGGEGVCPA